MSTYFIFIKAPSYHEVFVIKKVVDMALFEEKTSYDVNIALTCK